MEPIETVYILSTPKQTYFIQKPITNIENTQIILKKYSKIPSRRDSNVGENNYAGIIWIRVKPLILTDLSAIIGITDK